MATFLTKASKYNEPDDWSENCGQKICSKYKMKNKMKDRLRLVIIICISLNGLCCEMPLLFLSFVCLSVYLSDRKFGGSDFSNAHFLLYFGCGVSLNRGNTGLGCWSCFFAAFATGMERTLIC